jgi:hypothetical protein
MTDSERLAIHEWVACWKRAGVELERLRREELSHVDTQQALQNLASAFESCRLHHKPALTSGLVEQQRWFRKVAP